MTKGRDVTDAWAGATIVVRGGRSDPENLDAVVFRDGCWSVRSHPDVSLAALCRYIPHGTVRRTTVEAVRRSGGRVLESHDADYHCDVTGLSARDFDAILHESEPNPVPVRDRVRKVR